MITYIVSILTINIFLQCNLVTAWNIHYYTTSTRSPSFLMRHHRNILLQLLPPHHDVLSYKRNRKLYSTSITNNINDDNNNDNNLNDDSNNDDEEEEICVSTNDDEECEIDWSKMPGFTDDDDNDDTNDDCNNKNENDTTMTTASSSSLAASSLLSFSIGSMDMNTIRQQLERQFQQEPQSMDDYNDDDSKNRTSIDIMNHDKTNEIKTKDDIRTTRDIDDINYIAKEDYTIASESNDSTSNSHKDYQRLEMIWLQRQSSNSDECDVYEPITCGGHLCTSCNGNGIIQCRFCHGTKFLYLPITNDTLYSNTNHNHHNDDDFDITQRYKPKQQEQQQVKSKSSTSYISCSICETTGIETCRTCQGSGYIADWTEYGVRIGSSSSSNHNNTNSQSIQYDNDTRTIHTKNINHNNLNKVKNPSKKKNDNNNKNKNQSTSIFE